MGPPYMRGLQASSSNSSVTRRFLVNSDYSPFSFTKYSSEIFGIIGSFVYFFA